MQTNEPSIEELKKTHGFVSSTLKSTDQRYRASYDLVLSAGARPTNREILRLAAEGDAPFGGKVDRFDANRGVYSVVVYLD